MANLSDQERLFDAIRRDDLDTVKYFSSEDRLVANGGTVDLNGRDYEWGDTPLGATVTFGFTNIAKYLCQLPSVDVNAVDRNGASPLCVAAWEGQIEIVKALCAVKGVDPNKVDGWGKTPLMIAAGLNHLEILQVLTATTGIELNAVHKVSGTALSIAVRNGNRDVVNYLCRLEGVHVYLAKEWTSSSPLLIAAWYGRIKTMICLIDSKLVDVNFRSNKYKGETALHFAARKGRVRAIEALLKCKDTNLMIKNNKGQTPLDIAVKSRNRFEIGLMIACKMPQLDVNKQFQDGLTLLHMAVITENEDAMSYLCSMPGARNIKNKAGKTPFDLAAESSTCPLSFLISLHSLLGTEQININQKYRQGKTLLHIAVENNDQQATQRLLKYDEVEINASDSFGNTAIHYACLGENFNLQQLLIEREGANVMIENNDGLTPLYILSKAEENYPLILKVASNIAHLDSNIQFYNGNTLLHMAVLCQDKMALKYLTSLKKADSIENDEGYTPFDLAAINQNNELMMLFYEKEDPDFWQRSSAHSTAIEILSSDEKNYPFLLTLARKTPTITVNAKLAGGNTLLHMAVLSKNEKELRHLCHLPGAKNIKNDQNKTPFHLAAEYGPLKFLLHLYHLPGPGLRYINQAFRDRKTLLHLAVQEMDRESIKKLCSIQGIMNCRDSQRQTPFDLAIQQKNFPQALILLLYNCPGARLSSINTLLQNGKALLHIAVEENEYEFVESLLDNSSDVDVNIKDRDGLSVVHYAVLLERHDLLRLLCSKTNIDINLKYDDKSPLEMSVEEKSFEITLLLLSQETIDINDIRTGDGKTSIFNVLRTVVEVMRQSQNINESEDINFLETLSEKYLTERCASLEFIPALRELMLHDDPPLLNYLGKLEGSIHLTDSQKHICKALYNTIVKGLQQYVHDKRLKYVFLERHVLERSVRNLIYHKNSNSTTGDEYVIKMLKIVFLCLQLNNECTVSSKDFLKKSLQREDYKLFKELIQQLALKKTLNRNMEPADCSDSQLMANGILAIYYSRGTSFRSILRSKLNKADRKLSHLLGMSKILHDCTVRRTLSMIPCLWFIGVHISDFISDAIVGYQTFHGFSPRLGMFMIGLVIVSLIQENMRSHESLYRYERYHLQHILRRADLNLQDWHMHSNLERYNKFEWGLRQTLKFLWPFKVRGEKTKRYLRSLLFNMLSIIMLRPAIDRLIILTHFPTNIREILLQKANQISHRQYHMILEQIPELLIQFYLLQINVNNINSNETKTELTCFTNSTNNFEFSNEHFGCSDNLFGISDSCISTIQLYSVIVTFFRIPALMVAIERSFRKLDPATPSMSLAAHYSLYLIYMMMVPARIFFFTALMHSMQNSSIVVCYIAIMTLTMFLRNCLSMNQEERSIRNLVETLRKLKADKVVSLMLFSFRDIFFISLREPTAYIMTPAEVTHTSLRTSKTMMIFSLLFFIEGVIGAIVIERCYSCGMMSDIFRYQGWLYLALLVYSTMILTLLAYTLQPKNINILQNRFNRQASKICAFGLVSWMTASTIFLISTVQRTELEKILVITATVFMFVVLIGNTLILKHYGEAGIKMHEKPISRKDKGSEKSATNTVFNGSRQAKLSLRRFIPAETAVEEV